MKTRKKTKEELIREFSELLDKVQQNPMSKEDLRALFGKEYDVVEWLVEGLKSQRRSNEQIVQLVTEIVKGKLFLTPHHVC